MLETLADLPLFQGLAPAQLALFAPHFERFACAAETVIFKQEQPAHFLYLLVNGTAAIHFKPYDGPAITIIHLHRGDVFGWSAVVGSEYYTSGSFSTSAVEAIRIRGSDLWNFVLENPQTGRHILERLANVVSSRWKNAHAEVQVLFDKGLEQSKKQGDNSQIPRSYGSG